MALLSADSFNRANNASSLGSTDGAGTKDPATWVQAGGATSGISSNKAYASAIVSQPAIATVDLATGDVDISADVAWSTTQVVGLVFRFVDLANYWVLYFSGNTGIYLYKRVSNAMNTMLGPITPTGTPSCTARVVANGSSITVYKNGVSIGTVTDSFQSTATKHGFYILDANAETVDNWSASSVTAATTVTGTQASETDTGASGTRAVAATLAGGMASETDSAMGSTIDHETIIGGRALEQDVARAGYTPHPIAATCVRRVWLELGALTVDCHNEAAGYFVTSFDPGSPDIRDVVNNRPDADGIDDVTRYMGGRVVSVDITAISTAGAIIDEVATSFAPFMVPSVRPELHYVLDRPGLPERVLIVRGSKYSFKVDDAFKRDIQLTWVASDPVARDPDTNTATAWAGSSTAAGRTYDLTYDRVYPAGTASPIVGHLFSNGDVPVHPLLRIWGPATGATVTFDGAGGDGLVAFVDSYTISAGHYVEVDCDARTAYLDGHKSQSVLAFLDWAQMTTQGWPTLLPRLTATMTYTGGSTTDATQVIAYWNDGYLA